MRWFFSKNVWETFSERLFETLFRESALKYNFGYGSRDVRTICLHWKEPATKKELMRILSDDIGVLPNNDNIVRREAFIVRDIAQYVNRRFPPKKYYSKDHGELWKHPLTTLTEADDPVLRKKNGMDCDDYAILIYSLCRAAGVKDDNLWFCFMKTEGEWHLNLMYLHNGVPYAVEGTYHPDLTMKNFLKVPYFQNNFLRKKQPVYYYEYVKWRWNEKTLQRYTDKINPLQ